MSAENGSAVPQEASEIADKGKGKAADPISTRDQSMDDDEDDDDEEDSGPEEVCSASLVTQPLVNTS